MLCMYGMCVYVYNVYLVLSYETFIERLSQYYLLRGAFSAKAPWVKRNILCTYGSFCTFTENNKTDNVKSKQRLFLLPRCSSGNYSSAASSTNISLLRFL